MALFGSIGETLFEGVGGGILLGIGAVIVAPTLVPVLRPVAKEVIKGGLYVTDKAKEFVAETSEQWSDLVAEVKAEQDTNARAAKESEGSTIAVAKS